LWASLIAQIRPVVRVLTVAVVVGSVFGPLDLAGQVNTPYPLANLFNSPAIWAAAAFLFGLTTQRRTQAVVGAIVMEVVAVVSYYVAAVVFRGSDSSIIVSRTSAIWILLGIGAGIIFGFAGVAAHDQSVFVRAVGNGLLPGVFLAEGSHQLVRHLTTIEGTQPDDLVGIAILMTLLAGLTLVWRLRTGSFADRVQTICVTLAVALLGFAAYRVLLG
jgi:nitrogen fixation-related uncharacterized protein